VTAVRPLTLTIAALGGQGGGVVSDWLVKAASRERWLAQATSVPGVAQRTGATIYYLEFFPRTALPADGREPVMALMPDPGDVDVVVASELVEAGRAIARGIVTPDRTTLITSTHRDLTISERSALGDGRVDSTAILAAARAHANRLITLDMALCAREAQGHLSAVMIGAIAASGALPFRLESFREVVGERNRSAFQAGVSAVAGNAKVGATVAPSHSPTADIPQELAIQIERELPEAARQTARLAVERLIDYQDPAYASLYLDRLRQLREALPRADELLLVETVARRLALWMSFEDTIRVADLKIRRARRRQIQQDLSPAGGEIIEVTEFLRPRPEEICGSLPAGLGRRVLASPRCRRWLTALAGGRQVSTSRIGGFLLLKLIARLRRWRRSTLRFAEEDVHVRAWLALIQSTAKRDWQLAREIAECQQLVRGYGETHERGWAAFTEITRAAQALTGRHDAAAQIRTLREAAGKDEDGAGLRAALAAIGA
jgi:indolepyruvate ferredoxin oxidoreductase beta subunit